METLKSQPTQTDGINVISLFDGIANSYVATKRANLNYTMYYSSEIEKNALKVTQHHYENDPKFKSIGDVRGVKGSDFPDDGTDILVIYSFPCLDLSAIKKNREGLSGAESSLFFEAKRILSELLEIDKETGSTRKIYHLGENVASMRNIDKNLILDHLLELFPDTYSIKIDSQLVSACHRRRLYFTNISGIEQPEQLGIKLSDVIDSGFVDRDKSLVLLSSNITNYKSSLRRHYSFCVGTIIYRTKEFCDLPVDEKLIQFEKLLEISGYMPNRKNSEVEYPNSVFRLPTTQEYCKLMTMDSNYLDIPDVSSTSKVKLIGLSVTVDVIKHILDYLPSKYKINQI